MNLVVVESPAKAKTIKKYLGKDYNVLASMGHVRDLPSHNGSVDVDHDFEMKYQIREGAQRHVDSIVKAAKNSDAVFLASDPDREGEAIAWHIAQILLERGAIKKDAIFRCSFTEITPQAVRSSVAAPGPLNQNLVDAQQARLGLDYLVGFNLSPVLWKKLPGTRSAGRVQSVALRMIVENELKIKAFKSKEYWSIGLNLKGQKDKKAFLANVVEHGGMKFSVDFPPNKEVADKISEEIKNQKTCVVSDKKSKEFKQRPYPPFITSTLQQDASRKLGFSSKKTMQIAQRLYEGVELGSKTIGLITYMRTDGTTISKGAIEDIRKSVENLFGSEYLPKTPNIYKTKVRNAQEAHEAIRPTDASITPKDARQFLDKDQFQLYSLIWNRAVASQMNPAVKVSDSVEFSAEATKTKAIMSSVSIKFDGFLRLYGAEDEGDEVSQVFNNIEKGDVLAIDKILPKQHFTLPPPRFNEASLIKKMEELGIGRPSTYSPIISILQDRGYVRLEKKQFFAELKGMMVAAFLIEFFPQYVEYDFTAKLEEELDGVSNGEIERVKFLRGFWEPFHGAVEHGFGLDYHEVAKMITKFLKPYLFTSEDASAEECQVCHKGVMELHSGRFGAYLRCSRTDDCKNIVNFEKWRDAASDDGHADVVFEGREIALKNGPYGKYLRVKDGDIARNVTIPKDEKILDEEMIKKYSALPISLGKHPEKEKEIVVNVGRFGPYVGCDGVFASIKTGEIFSVTLEDALALINKKAANGLVDKGFKHPGGGDVIKVGQKKGVYVMYRRKYYSVPGAKSVDEVSLEDALKAIGVVAKKDVGSAGTDGPKLKKGKK